jgi:threonine dehydrogenase-like Zn-dependent dehydrogenase
MLAKAIKFVSAYKSEITEIEIPKLKSEQVLIQTAYSGICHSDILSYMGNHPFRILPNVSGHEASGVVVDVGRDVTLLQKGDKVSVEPHKGCGKCFHCMTGTYNVCSNKIILGVGDRTGTFAEYFIAEDTMCHKMPEGMSFEFASMIEPYAVGVHAVRISDPHPEHNALIMGVGTIGMMTLVAAKNAGMNKVFVSDISDTKLSAALNAGATHGINPSRDNLHKVINDLTDGFGVDRIYIAAPFYDLVEDALKVGCKTSTTTLIALLTGSADVDLTQLVLSEKRLIGSQTYTYLDYQIALSQNESNKLDMFKKLITDVFTPEDAMSVIDDLSRHRRGDSIKNLIRF